ncbi:MAG: GTPase HflX [Candidatus Cloacimonetes bacterium]|nr:GTPase HflX [Candidatus Cloacimonadota bacterium]
MEFTKEVKQRVFLIGLYTGKEKREEYERTVDELEHLSKTAGADVLGRFVQHLEKPNPATYIGKGKIAEIKTETKSKDIDTLIFNDNLSPAQAKNIARITNCNIVDRTELILDIFATHAQTKQAKMQVELAMLQYNYSKLRNLWQHFSRIEGGIGLRGPGETQIELDRREIKKKISILQRRIKDLDKISVVKRKKRSNLKNVSLIGYTNAGKTTLFNRITGEHLYVADQLFATLDSTTRAIQRNGEERIVISDTIGFIKKLPHTLVSSFHSTLLEVTEADLLLHVVDVSQPDFEQYIEAVNDVLQEIGADDKDILYVFNKLDMLKDTVKTKFVKKGLMMKYPASVFISAKYDENFEELFSLIFDYLSNIKREEVLHIPLEMKKLISFLKSQVEVLEKQIDKSNKEQILKVRIAKELSQKVRKQIDDYKFRQYINEE